MSAPAEVDVAIVGAGAGGAATAWRLAGHGIDVALFERGGWWPPEESPAQRDDWEWQRLGPYSPNPVLRRHPDDLAIDASESAIKPLLTYGVGGSTIMWSCHMPRFHPSDFAMRSLDGVGDDWPLTYTELAPFYALNEEMMGMAGLAGDPAYPKMPARPTPPPPIGPAEAHVAKTLDRLGWAWWPADMSINTAPYLGRGACANCGPCELGCVHRAKGTADVAYVEPALGRGARLVTGARVQRVLAKDGRAEGIVWRDRSGADHLTRARVVIVAASGINTPRLLLLSELANRSGLVGKRLMLHPFARVTGRFDDPIHAHRGIAAGAIVSHEFYESDPARDFKRGVKLLLMRSHGPLFAALGSTMPRSPWGRGHHQRFEEVFDHTLGVSVCADDLPEEVNRVTLSDRTDGDGLPIAKMHYRLGENSRRALDFGMARGRELLTEAGAAELHEVPLIAEAGFHLMGTTVMGDDPERSVTDRWGETHDVANLYVVDGSLFVTAAAVNPTHTLQALALRAADRIAATRRDA
ncbi:GMC family oxidoreductase [Acuticoccus mangrovi]|uniref:GMC family oxidoreductase n=1 Tax=Acuticoccus mangrovi TaxID=2796142 RepID=A0A934IND8_9HYPH|nr:GMC family oxidoreductase [Acuticoccus mangrovi]MBJ3775568.1 GMC family oxidoreductase [Acuticoccus mangrovi]